MRTYVASGFTLCPSILGSIEDSFINPPIGIIWLLEGLRRRHNPSTLVFGCVPSPISNHPCLRLKLMTRTSLVSSIMELGFVEEALVNSTALLRAPLESAILSLWALLVSVYISLLLKFELEHCKYTSGNLIGVYGTIDITSGGVLTNYSVDGASPAQVTSQAGSGDTFNQQFWNSPTLNEGDQYVTKLGLRMMFFDMWTLFVSELLVTMVKANQESQPGEGTIWFDYFLATDPRIQSSSTKSKNIGAIVGGVIGGIFFLIVIIALALLVLRRRNKEHLEHVQPWSEKGVDSLRTLFLKPFFFYNLN